MKAFSRPLLQQIDESKILGVRAGEEHRFTGVWVVVVNGRVFVRSWNDKPTGWFQAFLAEPRGAMQVGGREIRVRGRRSRGERVLEAIEAAYADKYNTAASRKWVLGFKRPRRRAATLELLPRG